MRIRDYQKAIMAWGDRCFGSAVNRDLRIRRNVLLEEVAELFQALEGSKDEAIQIVARTFSRPIGEAPQELGGSMVTLASLADAMGLSLEDEAIREMQRCEERTEAIREKRKTKPHAQLTKP